MTMYLYDILYVTYFYIVLVSYPYFELTVMLQNKVNKTYNYTPPSAS